VKKYLNIILAIIIFTLAWLGFYLLLQRPFLPGPAATAGALVNMAQSGRLFEHLGASLSRIFWAVLTSIFPAAALGLAAGRCPRVNSFISPVVYILHPLPKAAFLPVIMLFFGIGEAARVFLVGFIIFSQVLMTMRDCGRQVSEELLDAARSLGMGRGGLLFHVVIPSVLPGFFTALRISLGTAVAVLFLAETFAAQSGLGFLIMDAWSRLAYAEMYAGIMALSIIGLLLFFAVDFLEAIICPWIKPAD